MSVVRVSISKTHIGYFICTAASICISFALYSWWKRKRQSIARNDVNKNRNVKKNREKRQKEAKTEVIIEEITQETLSQKSTL